jgi:hypothetical protein
MIRCPTDGRKFRFTAIRRDGERKSPGKPSVHFLVDLASTGQALECLAAMCSPINSFKNSLQNSP